MLKKGRGRERDVDKMVLMTTRLGGTKRDSDRDTRKTDSQQDPSIAQEPPPRLRWGTETPEWSMSPHPSCCPHSGPAPHPILEPVGGTQQGADEAAT